MHEMSLPQSIGWCANENPGASRTYALIPLQTDALQNDAT